MAEEQREPVTIVPGEYALAEGADRWLAKLVDYGKPLRIHPYPVYEQVCADIDKLVEEDGPAVLAMYPHFDEAQLDAILVRHPGTEFSFGQMRDIDSHELSWCLFSRAVDYPRLWELMELFGVEVMGIMTVNGLPQ